MRHPRAGFTLVETLVALLILEFALLALVATSAVAARDLAAARLLDRARETARNRVERLAAGCPGAQAGTETLPAGLAEHWTVRAVGRERHIEDSVVVRGPRGAERSVVARTAVLCAG